MSYLQEFHKDDVLINTLTTYPKFDWVMLSGNIYLNDRRYSGFDIKTGTINLFEINVDRGTGLINPYVIKNGDLWTFSSATTSSYDQELYGTKLTGAYPYTSSLHREYISPLSSHLAGRLTPDGVLLPNYTYRVKGAINTDRQDLYWTQRNRVLEG